MAARFAAGVVVALLTAGALSACTQVEGDRIRAADLAVTHAEFASVSGDTMIAYAPRFGARRDLSAGEIAKLAQGLGVPSPTPRAACFERAGRSITPEELRAAMPLPAEWRLEILNEQYRARLAPPGRIQFDRAALPAHAKNDTATWKGCILDAQGETHPLWVSVRITAEQNIWYARQSLKPGDFLSNGTIELRNVRAYPIADDTGGMAAEKLIGRRVRRAIAEGARIRLADLVAPRDVERGDVVTVALGDGGALLRVEAESPGRSGEMVLLRNPFTGRRFQARVTGPRSAQMIGAKP